MVWSGGMVMVGNKWKYLIHSYAYDCVSALNFDFLTFEILNLGTSLILNLINYPNSKILLCLFKYSY